MPLPAISERFSASELDRLHALAGDGVSLPILLAGPDGISRANAWADGFIRGTHLCGGWNVLLSDENHGGCMLAALMLHHEHDAGRALRPPRITPKKREKLIVYLAAGLVQAYRHFRKRRLCCRRGGTCIGGRRS